MKVLIFDVPAENGGALSVLDEYYSKATKDVENNYIFVLSVPKLKETKNVKILNFPWVKKSWFHRIYFDKITSQKIVSEINPDQVLSLQNIRISRINVKQKVYLHQSLPFSEKKFSVTENFKFWVYQNLIGRMIKNSIKKTDEIIVQSNWMKKKVLEVNSNAIVSVEQPKLELDNVKTFNYTREKNFATFFFPASAEIYKNHKEIINASSKLVADKLDFRIIFTLDSNSNDKLVKELRSLIKIKSLPVDFVGQLPREKVFEMYSESVLIFPSDIESFGLPLLEAKKSNTPIIYKKKNYSTDILNDYVHCYSFTYEDELYKLMSEMILDGHKRYLRNI